MLNERNLDELLDQALSAYTAQEPQLGLETRILRQTSAPRSRRWLWSAIPAPAALALVIFLTGRPGREQIRPAPAPPTVAILPPEAPVRLRPLKRRVASGPTRQQLALAALVRDYPGQAITLTHEVPEPLTVEPLNIEPISVNALDQ